MTKSTVEVLCDAKALLETKGWTQGWFAKNAEGVEIGPMHPEAACFCGLGAIFACSAGLSEGRLAASGALRNAVIADYSCFPDFNDTEGRTLPEVLAKFDEAIAAEEAKLRAAEVPAQ